jgi:FdhD protein
MQRKSSCFRVTEEDAKTFARGFIARASQRATEQVDIQRFRDSQMLETTDVLAVEAPLELRLVAPSMPERTLTITMRTPGADDELALGYLRAEGVIDDLNDVAEVAHCSPPAGVDHLHNVIRVTLSRPPRIQIESIDRAAVSHASCGICGKTHIDGVLTRCTPVDSEDLRMSLADILRLPETLRAQQRQFAETGGVHAAALFNKAGDLLCVREDIGRHNALDKVIGQQVLSRTLGASGRGLLLSGRASFELIQKAAALRAEMVVSVGPPSSLAVEMAERSGMTLIGFVSPSGGNGYTHLARIQG